MLFLSLLFAAQFLPYLFSERIKVLPLSVGFLISAFAIVESRAPFSPCSPHRVAQL